MPPEDQLTLAFEHHFVRLRSGKTAAPQDVAEAVVLFEDELARLGWVSAPAAVPVGPNFLRCLQQVLEENDA